MTPEIKAKILKSCEFNPCEYEGVKLGEQIYGHHENHRLLPIITKLLSIIEAQGARLKDMVDTVAISRTHNYQIEESAAKSFVFLTETTALLEKLASGE